MNHQHSVARWVTEDILNTSTAVDSVFTQIAFQCLLTPIIRVRSLDNTAWAKRMYMEDNNKALIKVYKSSWVHAHMAGIFSYKTLQNISDLNISHLYSVYF